MGTPCFQERDNVQTSRHSSSEPFCNTTNTSPSLMQSGSPPSSPKLKPYPYFYYRDFSAVPDPDPLVPLTMPGRMPNFPAKMHSILSQTDLAHIIRWMPHGRSWKVLKPREFEQQVIPTYVSFRGL
jgi:HSF-type DNA-binding